MNYDLRMFPAHPSTGFDVTHVWRFCCGLNGDPQVFFAHPSVVLCRNWNRNKSPPAPVRGRFFFSLNCKEKGESASPPHSRRRTKWTLTLTWIYPDGPAELDTDSPVQPVSVSKSLNDQNLSGLWFHLACFCRFNWFVPLSVRTPFRNLSVLKFGLQENCKLLLMTQKHVVLKPD